ncbi:MAG: hypothetical protein LBG06_07495 [Deltaproteobacteria bacterium]|jgi:hypothetical protein|nr:hypothetical protein [Deltaproteobacteria bacterium]
MKDDVLLDKDAVGKARGRLRGAMRRLGRAAGVVQDVRIFLNERIRVGLDDGGGGLDGELEGLVSDLADVSDLAQEISLDADVTGEEFRGLLGILTEAGDPGGRTEPGQAT